MADDMVPKSDLIALKEGHTKALGELETKHADAITALGGEHSSTIEGLNTQVRTGTEELGRARATVADLEEKTKAHDATTEELKTSKSELKTAKDSLKAVQESLAGNMKATLMGDAYKIPEKALEGKTVAELKVVLDTLSASKGTNSNSYISGGGGGGAGEKTTGRQKVQQGLEAGDLKAT